MTTDRFVEIAGARIRYRDEGAGPPIVLLHGLGSSIEAWDEAVAALRDGYRVLAFDFPGFGLSDPVETAYTPDGAASFALRAATLPVAGEAFVTAIRLIPWLGVRGSFTDGGRIPPRLIEMTRRSFNKGAAGPSALGHMAFVEDHAAFTSILRESLASADRAARVEAS